MKVLNIFFIASLTYLTMGCAQFLVDYDYDRDANFASLRTFDWLPVNVPANELVIKHIKGAVNKELEAKGFMKNQTNPDFLIAIHGKKVKKRDVVSFEGFRGVSGYEVFVYEEGTITLTIRDAQSQEVIWRGTAEGELDYHPSAEKRRQRIYDLIAKILNKFPPPNE